jgi:hypothetical protein
LQSRADNDQKHESIANKEVLNSDDYDHEYFPARQCSALTEGVTFRAETSQPDSGVEAVSFKYSCIICSMEAGSTAAKQKAPPVSIQFRGAEHKTRLVFQAAEACLKSVSLVPLPEDHHLLRLSPCACHKLPVPVDISSSVCTFLIVCVALSYHFD